MTALRPARRDDIGAIERLIERSVLTLMRNEHDAASLRRSIGPLFGVDRQIIDDGTYAVIERDGLIVAAGGWSDRRVLFGGDATGARDHARVDPARDPAHIRAFYVDPAHARGGLGAALLRHSERSAIRLGFRRFALGATLTGVPFYQRHGYEAGEIFTFLLPDGHPFPLRHMSKMVVTPSPGHPDALPTERPASPEREPHR